MQKLRISKKNMNTGILYSLISCFLLLAPGILGQTQFLPPMVHVLFTLGIITGGILLGMKGVRLGKQANSKAAVIFGKIGRTSWLHNRLDDGRRVRRVLGTYMIQSALQSMELMVDMRGCRVVINHFHTIS